MFTDQYIQYKKIMFRNVDGWTIKDHTGVARDVTCSKSCGGDIGSSMHNAYCGSFSNSGVYFGAGTTPAAKTDYKLESIIESGLTISRVNDAPQLDVVGGKYVYSASYVVKNTGTENIVIGEIGYYGRLVGTYSFAALMERTVLDTPLTIRPGESKLITYKITFNQSQ